MELVDAFVLFVIVVAVLLVAMLLWAALHRSRDPFTTRTCRRCGTTLPKFAKFCRQCGEQV
ncbi:MAG: zinc-ribbon domain-containing protein [Phycisphaerae bacterium]|nr:zinc-ribbon domain-containing protein [Phycisphaerae bacterium]